MDRQTAGEVRLLVHADHEAPGMRVRTRSRDPPFLARNRVGDQRSPVRILMPTTTAKGSSYSLRFRTEHSDKDKSERATRRRRIRFSGGLQASDG